MIYTYATNTSSPSYSDKDYYNVFESENDVYSFSDKESISSGILIENFYLSF